MNEVVTRWFGRLHRVSGVVAYGLYTPEPHVYSRTWDPQFSESALHDLWPRLNQISAVAISESDTTDSMRWTFRDHLVMGARRADGLTFYALRLKEPKIVDEAGLERLLNEFRGLRTA